MPREASFLNVSTKTGDGGQTGLANGQRLAKDAQVFDVVGTLDELNSWLGVVITHFQPLAPQLHTAKKTQEIIAHLYHIQDTLFYIGAELAGSPKAHLAESELTELERHSTALQKLMAENWTTQFLLPGGTQLGAWCDVTRTVCRRSERVLVAYSREVTIRPVVLKYINRLSDYLYVIRCWVNQELSYEEKKFHTKVETELNETN